MLQNKKTDGRIFISYRRSDANGYAGRLEDSLEEYFGNNRVFRDIEDIKGGAAFGEVIEKNIRTADAVIVLSYFGSIIIGTRMLTLMNMSGFKMK